MVEENIYEGSGSGAQFASVLGFHLMNGYINLIATVHGNTGFMELMEEGVVRWI